MNTNIRSATHMERARTKAIGFSAFLVVLMLTVAIAFTAIALDTGPKKDEETGDRPVVFTVPVSGTNFDVVKEFTNGLQFNKTAKRWEGHKAIVITAPTGTAVLATYAGTVSSITFSPVQGKIVTIEHGLGLKTVYSGLEESVSVVQGSKVNAGQQIGAVGTTYTLERFDQPHVRVEVFQNNLKVNPANFIPYGKT